MGAWDEGATGVVTLPDGRRIRGRGLRSGVPHDQPVPEFAVHVTGRSPTDPGWECRWVPWPDFWLPCSPSETVAVLRQAHDRSADERVEITCAGGNGRTGAALAILARLAGVPAGEAVSWVREHYRPTAVETPWQRWFVRRVLL